MRPYLARLADLGGFKLFERLDPLDHLWFDFEKLPRSHRCTDEALEAMYKLELRERADAMAMPSQCREVHGKMCKVVLILASLFALSEISVALQADLAQQVGLKRQDPSQSFISDSIKQIQPSFPSGSHQAKPVKLEEEEDGFIMQTSSLTSASDDRPESSTTELRLDSRSATMSPEVDETTKPAQSDDQSIPIDSNRQQFITHDQLSASTKDENISISSPDDDSTSSWSRSRHKDQAVKSQRANTSKVSYVSALFSDLLSYASLAASNKPTEGNASATGNNSQEEEAQQVTTAASQQASGSSSYGQACPGICRNILAASLLCQNEIDAVCPSVFQKCCDKSDLAFNGTPVETSAPVTSPDLDFSNSTPMLNNLPQTSAQADRTLSAANEAGLHDQRDQQQQQPPPNPFSSERSRGPTSGLDEQLALGSQTLYFLSSGSGDSSANRDEFASTSTSQSEVQPRPNGQMAQSADEQPAKSALHKDPATQPLDLPVIVNSSSTTSHLNRRLETASPPSTNLSGPDTNNEPETMLTGDGSSEPSSLSQQDDTRAKCVGFCSLPLFTLLCDSSYDSPDCEPSRKCCVVNEKMPTEEHPSQMYPVLDSSDQSGPTSIMQPAKPSTCRGSCLPVYHSSLCTKPNEVQIDSPGCLPNFVCCLQPANLQEGTNQLDETSTSEQQPSSLNDGSGVRAETAPQTGAKDSSLAAALVPPPPPGADSGSIQSYGLQSSDQVSARQRPLSEPSASTSQARQPAATSHVEPTKQDQSSFPFGGIMNQLYSMFKLNSAPKQKPRNQAPVAMASTLHGSLLEPQQAFTNDQHPSNPGLGQLYSPDSYLSMSQTRPEVMAPHVPIQSAQVLPVKQVGPQLLSHHALYPSQQPMSPHVYATNLEHNRQTQTMKSPHQSIGPQVHQSVTSLQALSSARHIRPSSASVVPPNQSMSPGHPQQYQVMKQVNVEQNQGNINRIPQQSSLLSYPAVHFQPARQYTNPQVNNQHPSQSQQQRYSHPQPQAQFHQHPQFLSNQQTATNQQQVALPAFVRQQIPSQVLGESDRANNKFTRPVVSPRPGGQSSVQIRPGSGDAHEPMVSIAKMEQRPSPALQRQSQWAPSGLSNVPEVGGSNSPIRTQEATRSPESIPSSYAEQAQPYHVEIEPKRPQASTSRPTSTRSTTKLAASSRPRPSVEPSSLLNPSSSNLNVLISNGPFIDLQRVTESKPIEEPSRGIDHEKAKLCSGVCLTLDAASHCTHPLQVDDKQICNQPNSLCCVKVQTSVAESKKEATGPRATLASIDGNRIDPNIHGSEADDQLESKPLTVIPQQQHLTTSFMNDEVHDTEVHKVTRDHTTSCGRPGSMHRQTSGLAKARVMGGFEAKPGYWCWQVALMNDKNEYLCGGALIGAKWVLTAAHCITQHLRSESQLYARLGHHDLNSTQASDGARNIKIKTSYVHHNHNGITLDNDIALLRLSSAVELDDSSVCLVCLPERNSQVGPGRSCTVTGYGFESELGPAALKVRQTQLPIVADGECQNKTSAALGKAFTLPASSFCAGGELGQDACHGDGGSPLSCLVDGYYELTGIVSWGYKCGNKDLPGLYSKVSSFVGWINQIVSANN